MPTLISKDEALARIVAEGGQPECLMCAVLEGRVGGLYTIFEDDEVALILPRYVRCWGHVAVVPKRHVVTFTECGPELWAHIQVVAYNASRMLEAMRAPKRVYNTSTGSNTKELTQTSRHIHVHLIPVDTEEDRPSDVFTWAHGIWVAEHDEWIALRDECRRWWSAHA
ncbi:MAG: HIT domain-containing protein [Polyangiales bacterium]